MITVMKPGDPKAEGERVICSTVDVSESGMRISCNRLLVIKAMVRILIAVKEPAMSFKLKGRVRWYNEVEPPNPYFIGIEFVENPAEILNHWKEIVDQKLPSNVESERSRKFEGGQDVWH